MRVVHNSTVVTVPFFLLGCVGTMDSVHTVEGEAPADARCEVRVLRSGTSEVIKQQAVSGRFSISYLASGPAPGKVDVTAYCNGSKVREVPAFAPRGMEVIDLGVLAP
jgi:hypothetical protein